VIVTFTGDQKHSVVVGVLGVPVDESTWSPRLRLYFKAIQQYHARPKETPLGELMVTNLSSFPSALTVIPVPDGDIRKHRQIFIVNEDLKRLGCSGRSALTLSDPTTATQDRFIHSYKTSERNPFFQSVLELIKLCQVSLFLFGHLEQEYIDGLLCDLTETAIGNWWTEIGAEHYNIEPTDGILGPTTVAALLGMLMGARNRLHWCGAPVTKDVFDIESTKRGIAYFQKYYKIEKKTRRLDRQTILKLHSVTAKAAAGEGWGVQRAVKSTVAEIGGKRGEMVIGMVGGRRDKAGIGDIETLHIDKFIGLANGERAKWLWHGKQRRTVPHPHEKTPEMSTILFGKEEVDTQANKRTQSLPLEEELEARRRDETPAVYSAPAPDSATSVAESPGDRDARRKTVFKSVAGRMSDARSGLGRIKDAVGGGLRGHVSRPSRDEGQDSAFSQMSIATLAQSSTTVSSPAAIGRAFTWKQKPEEYLNALKEEGGIESLAKLAERVHEDETAVATGDESNPREPEEVKPTDHKLQGEFSPRITDAPRDKILGPPSTADSTIETDLQGPYVEAERNATISLSHLHRRHSIELSRLSLKQPINENRWPRRLSFGDAEEAVLRWEEVVDIPEDGTEITAAAIQAQNHLAEVAQSLYESIVAIKESIEPWVSRKIDDIELMDDRYGQEQEDLQRLYYQLTEAYQSVKQNSSDLVAEERGRLTESIKDIEVLVARLEYEINSLVSKVEDVEDGVIHFERQVGELENRADELRTQLETESWLHWFVRTLTGIGTGPNITRTRK
jgi:hypothetical protein